MVEKVEKVKGVCGAELTVTFLEEKGAKVNCANRTNEIIFPNKDVTLEECVQDTCNKTCLLLKKGRVAKKIATDDEKRDNFINMRL